MVIDWMGRDIFSENYAVSLFSHAVGIFLRVKQKLNDKGGRLIGLRVDIYKATN